jgi:GNAT superfamily N-acetyltransferase
VSRATIRTATEEDAEGLVRAHEAAWDATLAQVLGSRLDELAPLLERVERARASLASPPEGTCAWVAETDGEIVGMAVAKDAELRDLYVVPSAWGVGVAVALMQTALDWIAAHGAKEAFLWVGEANSRARRFYEREGWKADDETRTSVLGPPELRYRRIL